MTSTFISHEWKSFWRSRNKGKSIAIRIVMGIFIVYLLANFLFLGFFFDKILEEVFPNDDVVDSFSSILLYYFLIDIVWRFQLQELPTLSVQPYLHLPIRKNTLVGYLSMMSMKSLFNLNPFILLSPFIFKVIRPDFGSGAAWSFMLAILGLTIFNNYFSLWVKRKTNLNGWYVLAFTALIVLTGLADFKWHLFSIRTVSHAFFNNILHTNLLALLPLPAGLLMFGFNFLFLRRNLYLEELGAKKGEYKSSSEFPLLNRFGIVGDLVANELKLILRNKRSRSALIMGVFFMLYGLLFYTNKIYGDGWKVFCGMFMTGIFIINYGQFQYAWQSAHFDGLLVSRIRFTDYLKAKFILFTLVSTGFFILTIPYVYFGWKVLLVHLVMYLWNIGVNITLVLFFANRNFKRMDLSKGASFNWEGVGATQWILSIPLLLTPFVIYWPLNALGYQNVAYAALATTGLAFVLTRGWWIKKLQEDYEEKKYSISEGFRNR
ncbi:MAG: hypothetical protein INR69_04460 [Mucilaginibacter polytrichastri]|nr:hypothetical protein [Mucilaginibacter polytrichastri]